MKFKILLCGILFSLAYINTFTFVQSINASTSVSYEPSSDQIKKHFLEVIVRGKGTVFDGTQSIGIGTIVYEMKYSDSKTLTFKPDKDCYVKRLEINGQVIDTPMSNSISFCHIRQDTKVIIEFDKRVIENTEQKPNQIPSDQSKDEGEFEKDVIIVITQDIPLNEMDDVITEMFIKKYLNINDNYKILSHNIQKKPGVYEVIIRLSDGTVRKVTVHVVAPESIQEVNKIIDVEKCKIHLLMILLLIFYCSYNVLAIVMKKKEINKLKKRQRKESVMDEKN